MPRTQSQIISSGLIELVGKDETVAQNKFAGSVAVPINDLQDGGYIVGAVLNQDPGAGALLSVAGVLFFLSADPTIAVGDADLTLAEWRTVFSKLSVAAGDWINGTVGGVATYSNLWMPFPKTADGNIYLVFRLISATSINSDAEDEEILQIRILYSNEKNRG